MLRIILCSCLKCLHHKFLEKQYLVIISSYRTQASEPQADSKDQTIAVSEVGLKSEIDRYSYGRVLPGTVPIPSLN